LIDNIVEDHHLIVEANTRTISETTIIQMIVEMTIIQTIDEVNFEVNFEADRMIDFNQIVALKDVLYVKNLIVDQSIIRKTSATTRKSASQIDILNSETLIAFVSTF
jgi:hypothetical protein